MVGVSIWVFLWARVRLVGGLVWGVKPAISGRQGEAYERNQGGEERVRGRECEKWMGVFSGKGFVGF